MHSISFIIWFGSASVEMIRNLCSDELQPKRERWSCLALLQDFPLKLLKKKYFPWPYYEYFILIKFVQ